MKMNDMGRRQFLKLTGAAIVAGSTARLYPFAVETASKRPLKKAVNLGMVTTDGSTAEKFKLLKEIGFDGTVAVVVVGPVFKWVAQQLT
jgi:hexulose-6-phosphate isomerase